LVGPFLILSNNFKNLFSVYFLSNETSKNNKKILPLLQKKDRTKNKISGNRISKRNIKKRLKRQGKIKRTWKRNRKQGEMGK